MDREINPSDLRPTKTDNFMLFGWEKSTLPTETILYRLQEQTKTLLRHPYDASNWISRGETLVLLGYPELAAGDAIKAMKLCDTVMNIAQSRSDECWRFGSCGGFLMRDEELRVGDQPELSSSLLNLFSNLQGDARKVLDCCTRGVHPSVAGGFIPQPYPWMEERHQRRSEEVVEGINEDIRRNEAKTLSGEAYIEVKRCVLQSGDDVESDMASLGVFATCDIEKDTKILVDVTDLFGCNGPGVNNSKANLHGGEGCLQRDHPNLPGEDASLNLRWIRDLTGTSASNILLLCRTLLCSIQQNLSSPLDLPSIARLTPSYHRQTPRIFDLNDHIRIPNDALQQFGVDIFANHAYDTWVLFALRRRLSNNSWSSPIAMALSPIFSLFNHSCEPNCEWKSKRDHRTLEVRVERDVVKGEQLFVEYDSYAREEDLEERRDKLKFWIERCMCSRCAREEGEERSLRGRPMDGEDKEGDDDQDVHINGLLGEAEESKAVVDGGSMNKKAQPPTWDVWDRPSLPEDPYWERSNRYAW